MVGEVTDMNWIDLHKAMRDACSRGEVLYYVPPTPAAPYVLVSIRDPRGAK